MKRTILFFLAALQAINIFSQTEEYAVLIGWSFANGVLSIFSPTGEPAGMPDYETSEYADLTGKWAADWFHEGLRHQIEEIIIREGVVNVGANAFYEISNRKQCPHDFCSGNNPPGFEKYIFVDCHINQKYN